MNRTPTKRRVQHRWISSLLIVVGLGSRAALATAQTDPARTRSPTGADIRTELHGYSVYREIWDGRLTGSITWVDSTGTGICFRLRGGHAQLDTPVVNGPGGRIEGLTLRLYNPKSHQWRLYWANSNDSAVDVPQTGQFRNVHDEFYAQDGLNGKSIFVRYDWTALASESPHFGQAFSEVDGKTWEVNWITEQTRIAGELLA
jgi:hypothetical protein